MLFEPALDAVTQGAFSLLSPPGVRARLSILIFHRVLPQADPLLPDEPDPKRFDQVCTWVRRWFNVLPLHEACKRLHDGSLPARALAITFDDGYADNHDVAMPILSRHGLSATFFVASGFLDGGRMWNDTLIEAVRKTRQTELQLTGAQIAGIGTLTLTTAEQRRAAIQRLIVACRYLPQAERDRAVNSVCAVAGVEPARDLMLTSRQLQGLHAAGMSIGGHTVTHPILKRIDISEARQEISQGKQRLESLIQAPVTLFAYPNGRPDEDYGLDHVEAVREAGFQAAVTTGAGYSDRSSDPFQLPRFTPWRRSKLAYGAQLARNLRAAGKPSARA